jgi:hypothetical protein
MCQTPALLVTLLLPRSCTRTRLFGISILACYLASHECLFVSECVLMFGRVACLCLCLCECLCVFPGMWRCRGAGRGVGGRGGDRTR